MHALLFLFVFCFNTFSHSYAVLYWGVSGSLEEQRRVCKDLPKCGLLLIYFMLVLDQEMVLTKVLCDMFFITAVLSLNTDHTKVGGRWGGIADTCSVHR